MALTSINIIPSSRIAKPLNSRLEKIEIFWLRCIQRDWFLAALLACVLHADPRMQKSSTLKRDSIIFSSRFRPASRATIHRRFFFLPPHKHKYNSGSRAALWKALNTVRLWIFALMKTASLVAVRVSLELVRFSERHWSLFSSERFRTSSFLLRILFRFLFSLAWLTWAARWKAALLVCKVKILESFLYSPSSLVRQGNKLLPLSV